MSRPARTAPDTRIRAPLRCRSARRTGRPAPRFAERSYLSAPQSARGAARWSFGNAAKSARSARSYTACPPR